MSQHYEIAPQYASVEGIKILVENLVERFANEGRVIFTNKRNVIKCYDIEGVGRVVVKRFGVRNIFQRVHDSLRGSSKARRAYDNGLVLREYSIPTPEAVAYSEVRVCGFLTESYYVTLYTEDGPIEEMFHKPLDLKLARAYAELIAKMHKNGIVHHDMNRFNVLYRKDSDGEYHLSVIDINRMTVSKGNVLPPYKECKEDIVKLTERIDFVAMMTGEYAKLMGYDEYQFMYDSMFSKMWAGWRWHLKKWRIVRCIKMLVSH